MIESFTTVEARNKFSRLQTLMQAEAKKEAFLELDWPATNRDR
jgi:hypothetical protein